MIKVGVVVMAVAKYHKPRLVCHAVGVSLLLQLVERRIKSQPENGLVILCPRVATRLSSRERGSHTKKRQQNQNKACRFRLHTQVGLTLFFYRTVRCDFSISFTLFYPFRLSRTN